MKAIIILTKLITTLRPQCVINKGNWLEWGRSLPFYIIADAMHSFLVDTYKLAFAKRGAAEIGEPDLAQHLANASVTALVDIGDADPDLSAMVFDGVYVDPSERQREENAYSVKQSLQFMSAGMWRDVYMMGLALHPESVLMHALVHMVSAEWEKQQQASLLELDSRDYRCCLLQSGILTDRSLALCMELFKSTSLWQSFHPTEAFRSKLLQLFFRSSSVIYQLIKTRTEIMPYKLFSLLSAPDHEVINIATRILNETPRCLYDSWSRCYVERYNTAEKLSSTESLLVLELIARKAQANTFTTEALHSRNLRKAVSRHATHKPDLKHLAVSHSAEAMPVWMREDTALAHRSGRRGGRPKKKKLLMQRRLLWMRVVDPSPKREGLVVEDLGVPSFMSV